MPKYKITAPDGKAYVVTAPDGATQEQVLAYAQQHYGQQEQPAARVITEPTITVSAHDPVTEMSTTDRVLTGIGKFMSDQARGLHQIGNAALDPFGVDAAINPAVAAQNEQLKQDQTLADQRDAPLLSTGAGKSGYYGSQLASLLLPAGVLRGTRAMSAVLPTTIRGNAIQGVVQGLAAPVGEGDSRAGNAAIGGTLGSLTAGIFKGAGMIRGAIKNAGKLGLSSLDRSAADALLREADDSANLTRAAPSQVPGVQRTLAEETLDPGIARLERNLRSTNKQFDALDRSNNAARVGALEKIAGSDADYANAEAAREKVTGNIRDMAFREGARRDAAQSEQSLLQRGVGNQVDSTKGPLEAQIQAIANANKGRPSVLSTMASVSKAVQDAGDSVAGLYNVRKYIGDLLSGKAGADTSAAQSATRELMSVRDALDKELTKRAPTFSRYLMAYQDFSKPLNRMDIGRELMERSSGSAVPDAVTGQQVLTPAQFSKKARDLDAVAAKATGFAKAKATDILSPTDIASIKAIQDDLERQFFRATAGSGGNSHTFERQAIQERLARGAGRQALRRIPVVGSHAGDFLDMLEKSRNDRVKERLAYLVANPAEARRVLSALPPAGQKIVSDALTRLGGSVGRVATAQATAPDSQQ